jgi:hypothetical protein
MSNAKRDDNYVPTLLGVSIDDLTTPVPLAADPDTNRLLVQDPISAGAYDTLIDSVGATTYVGEAVAGTLPSVAEWRIQKIDESINPVEVRFADGVTSFTKEWDERASYTY